MNSTCTSRELHMNRTRTSRERHLKPVTAPKDTSHEQYSDIFNSDTLRIIKTKNNNLLHVLDLNEEEELKKYLAFLREGEVHMNTSREELLTAEQAGILLDKTARHVYTYIRQGKLREVKVTVKGRERIRVPLSDVEYLREELGVSPEVHVNSTGSSHEVSPEVHVPAYEVHEEDVQPVPVEQPKEETKYLVDVWAEVDRRIAQAVQPYMEKVEKLEAQNKVLLDRLNAIEERHTEVDKFIIEWREDKKERKTKEENRPWLGRLLGKWLGG